MSEDFFLVTTVNYRGVSWSVRYTDIVVSVFTVGLNRDTGPGSPKELL